MLTWARAVREISRSSILGWKRRTTAGQETERLSHGWEAPLQRLGRKRLTQLGILLAVWLMVVPTPTWAQFIFFIPGSDGRDGPVDPLSIPAAELDVVGTNSRLDESFTNTLFPGANTIASGGFLLKAGNETLTIDGSTISGDGEFHVANGVVAQTDGTTNITFLSLGSTVVASIPATSTSALNVSGGTITFSTGMQVGDFGGTGTVNQTGGAVVFGGSTPVSLNIGNQGGAGIYNLSGGTLSFDGAGVPSFVVLGRNADSGTIIAQTRSTGVLNLSGSGVMEVTHGASLFIGSNAFNTNARIPVAGSGTINQTGGTLSIDNSSQLFLSGAGNGTYNLDGGKLQIGGSSLLAGNGLGGTPTFNLGGGTIQVIGSALTTTVEAHLVAGTSTIDTNGFGATWSGMLDGGGGLTKAGVGTLTLSGPNIYTGATTVAGGTLAAGAVGTLPRMTAVTVAAGTLDLAGFNQSIGSLGAAGLVTLGSATLTTGNDNTSTTFSGAISGAGALDKVGTGTFILDADNSYAAAQPSAAVRWRSAILPIHLPLCRAAGRLPSGLARRSEVTAASLET